MTLALAFSLDRMSLLLAALVVGVLSFARLAVRESPEPLRHVLLKGSLSLIAVFTLDLALAVTAIVLFSASSRDTKERKWSFVLPPLVALFALAAVGYLAGGTDFAIVASSHVASSGLLTVLILSIGAIWLFESRNLLRGSTTGLTSGVASSFALQAAVGSVLLRTTAWLADDAPTGTIQFLALAALGTGALGALSSIRITTFLTSLALARAGFVLLALLGGVHGRAPFLLVLAAGGVALLLVALAAENLETLDDAARIDSAPLRLCLGFGALTACSFPPFPGYLAAFPLLNALLLQGYWKTAIAAGILVFLLGVGSMRLVARASSPQTSASSAPGRRRALLGLGLALVATLALTVSPSSAIELANRAALEMF